jgi:hypothetical protein
VITVIIITSALGFAALFASTGAAFADTNPNDPVDAPAGQAAAYNSSGGAQGTGYIGAFLTPGTT